jgi:hypothetical protein
MTTNAHINYSLDQVTYLQHKFTDGTIVEFLIWKEFVLFCFIARTRLVV